MLLKSSIALAAVLATTASCIPFIDRRQDKQVVFRTDLKEGENQSPKYKGVMLSHVESYPGSGQYNVTFVTAAETDKIDKGVVNSLAIPMTMNGVSQSMYMSIANNWDSVTGLQPVKLSTTKSSQGWFYTVMGELKIASASPSWDTWVVCDGASGYPGLYWMGVVNLKVDVPKQCSAVRLYADSTS